LLFFFPQDLRHTTDSLAAGEDHENFWRHRDMIVDLKVLSRKVDVAIEHLKGNGLW
jgi:hypothetical protein